MYCVCVFKEDTAESCAETSTSIEKGRAQDVFFYWRKPNCVPSVPGLSHLLFSQRYYIAASQVWSAPLVFYQIIYFHFPKGWGVWLFIRYQRLKCECVNVWCQRCTLWKLTSNCFWICQSCHLILPSGTFAHICRVWTSMWMFSVVKKKSWPLAS